MGSQSADQTLSVVRSEEQVRLRQEWIATERFVVRRRIVTETVQLTATIRREELVFDQSPVSEALATGTAPEATAPLVLVLLEELPVLTMVTRPYESVTISVVKAAGEQQVAATLNSERIEVFPSDDR
jgi:hypothetical protein